jgi:antitoxin YefM
MVSYRELDSAMQVVSFSEARERFKAVLDRVEADADVTLITRRHAQGAVVMSLDTYNSLMETVHLLRSPANAAHLQRSLEQAERRELLAHPLIDANEFNAAPLDAGS